MAYEGKQNTKEPISMQSFLVTIKQPLFHAVELKKMSLHKLHSWKQHYDQKIKSVFIQMGSRWKNLKTMLEGGNKQEKIIAVVVSLVCAPCNTITVLSILRATVLYRYILR